MEITFTKEQYENLIKLVYLGNWMINAIRGDDQIKKYEDLEQYVYSFYKEFGLEQYIEYDEEFKKYYPTNKLEMESDAEQYRQDYDEENFWDELLHNLARRDFIKEYGINAIKKMSMEERFKKEQPLLDKYGEEFEKYGIERLRIEK